MIADRINSFSTNFATYPDGIFKGVTKLILYTIIPVGFANYLPLKTMLHFNPVIIAVVVSYTIFMISFAFFVFYRGIKRYSSTNLMNARI